MNSSIACVRGDAECVYTGCSRLSTLRCDYKIDHWGRTCDAPMCQIHSLNVGWGRDHCLGHTAPKEQARMKI